jgi:hypothetical protein
MAVTTYRIMLSSTTRDLPDHRKAALDAINRLDLIPRAMEFGTAWTGDAIDFSLKLVDEADLYVGIFGLRYGYVPDDANKNPLKISVTEMEYRRALERKLPMLLFVMDSQHPIPASAADVANFIEMDAIGKQKLEALRKEITTKYVVAFFKSPEELNARIYQALGDWLKAQPQDDTQKKTQLTPIEAQGITGERDLLATLPLLRSVPLRGRAADVEKIKTHLAQKPTLIIGVGGLGKSRLAAEIVLHHAHGAVWHKCTETSRAADALDALRQHYGLPASDDRPEVLQRVAQNPCLVVLDNAESIEKDAVRRREYLQLVRDLHAQQAQILLTTRVDYTELMPRQSYSPETLPLETATQLTLDMADALGIRDRVENIAVETAEKARLHPRLIEWAVGQMAHRDPNNILKQLTELTHKHVQAALDEMILQTVRQMVDSTPDGAAAEKVLQQLVVFRGGFTFEAALYVVNTTPAPSPLATPPLNPLPIPQGGDLTPPLYEVERGQGGEVNKGGEVDEDTLYDRLEILSIWRFVRYDANAKRYSIDDIVFSAIPADATALDAHFEYYKALAKQHDGVSRQRKLVHLTPMDC